MIYWIMFDRATVGYTPGCLALVENPERPIVGIIANTLDEDAGYFVNTSNKPGTIIKEIDVCDDVLYVYYVLIKENKLNISFWDLVLSIPTCRDLKLSHWKKKISTIKNASELGLI